LSLQFACFLSWLSDYIAGVPTFICVHSAKPDAVSPVKVCFCWFKAGTIRPN
jgi:hypothetical protein